MSRRAFLRPVPLRLLALLALLAAPLWLGACGVSGTGSGYPPPTVGSSYDPYPAGDDADAADAADEVGAESADVEEAAPAEADAASDSAAEAEGEAEGEGAAAAPGDLGGRLLVVGTDASYPPFETVDDSGAIVGFDPDLMNAICQLANCVPEFRSTAWDGIFAALAAGEFDALMSAITILPEREAESGATFTRPYYQVGQVILAHQDSALASLADLPAAIVGVQTGTTGDLAATEDAGVPEANMRRFDSNALAVQALLNRDVDAVVSDDPTALNYQQAHPEELRIVGEPFTVEQYGILVRDDEPEVLAALNQAIERLQDSGVIEGLEASWIQSAAE